MKRTVSFALSAVLALAMLLFIGCKGNETQPKQADVEAVYTKLVESGQLPSMTKVPERDLEEVYGIDKTKLAQWTMYLSENYAVTVGEVSILRFPMRHMPRNCKVFFRIDLTGSARLQKNMHPPRPQNSILWKCIASAIMFTWLRAATTMLS